MSSHGIHDLDDLAAAIPDGAKLAIPADYSGVAVAATLALIRRGARRLHLVCVPVSGLQADLLIGAGAVETIETSAVTLGEFGAAPRFVDAVRRGKIVVKDATCPAIHAGLQAAEKGLPFMPLRGIIGSDLLANRLDWKVIDNPFAEGDRIVALPAIKPDIALFHAPLADRNGNVFVGRRRELRTMAHAAAQSFVTVEEISERDLLADESLAAGVIPALYVSAIVEAKAGAWPLGLWDRYGADEAFLRDYAVEAKTEEGFRRMLAIGRTARCSRPGGPSLARSRMSMAASRDEATREELLIATIAGLLAGCRHVAVGASSPIPGAGALLARAQSSGALKVSVLGSVRNNFFTDGGVELFDCAAQGRVDAFFLGGGQIDGQGNINLVGTGRYPQTDIRWPGSFGSAYLYFLVKRVILFREEHSRRVLVDEVDFISAPGTSPEGVYRPGGPHALLTNLALFDFDRTRRRFRLRSVHPGHSVEEVGDNTGFAFDRPENVETTPAPDEATLALIRKRIRGEIAETYPRFAAKLPA